MSPQLIQAGILSSCGGASCSLAGFLRVLGWIAVCTLVCNSEEMTRCSIRLIPVHLQQIQHEDEASVPDQCDWTRAVFFWGVTVGRLCGVIVAVIVPSHCTISRSNSESDVNWDVALMLPLLAAVNVKI